MAAGAITVANRQGRQADTMGIEIRRIGIIGAGQMGSGIAHVCALSGYTVAINDLKKESYDRGLEAVGKNIA